MAALSLDEGTWAQQQFGACAFGDSRRTRRLVTLATQAAAKPDASTPEQTERWADCKAAYRLLDQDEVTFEAVVAPHCLQTRAVGPGTWLVLNDTTELCFGYQRDLPGAGRVGKTPDGRGFYLHTALVVSPDGLRLPGLAAQDLYVRPLKKVPRVSSSNRKQLRQRETDVWGRVIDRTGRAPEGARFIHVCDRGADNFDVYCHLLEQDAGWVIRAAQLKRRLHDERGVERSLDELLASCQSEDGYELTVRANRDQPARTAELEVRDRAITMPRPRSGVSRYVQARGVEAIPMWAVEVREVRPPRDASPLRWALLTSERVESFDDAWRIIEHHERRPLIEEYHKCLKTGCRVESRQYHKGERLAPVIGLLAVLAVRLLQLKLLARTDPEQPAAGVVPAAWLATLPRLRKAKRPLRTIRDFFHALAGLGGFLGRKDDGEPGWQTVWRGLQTLLLCLRGVEAANQKCG